MKDTKGKTITKGATVRISDIKVMEWCLPVKEGVVLDCRENKHHLVSVKLPIWDEPIDVHSKSLTVI